MAVYIIPNQPTARRCCKSLFPRVYGDVAGNLTKWNDARVDTTTLCPHCPDVSSTISVLVRG